MQTHTHKQSFLNKSDDFEWDWVTNLKNIKTGEQLMVAKISEIIDHFQNNFYDLCSLDRRPLALNFTGRLNFDWHVVKPSFVQSLKPLANHHSIKKSSNYRLDLPPPENQWESN